MRGYFHLPIPGTVSPLHFESLVLSPLHSPSSHKFPGSLTHQGGEMSFGTNQSWQSQVSHLYWWPVQKSVSTISVLQWLFVASSLLYQILSLSLTSVKLGGKSHTHTAQFHSTWMDEIYQWNCPWKSFRAKGDGGGSVWASHNPSNLFSAAGCAGVLLLDQRCTVRHGQAPICHSFTHDCLTACKPAASLPASCLL